MLSQYNYFNTTIKQPSGKPLIHFGRAEFALLPKSLNFYVVRPTQLSAPPWSLTPPQYKSLFKQDIGSFWT